MNCIKDWQVIFCGKILILGIGNTQLDAIRSCKELGMEVHACSNNEYKAGLKFLDYFSLIDIVNYDAICQYVRDNKIKWVYSVGSDMAMPTVSAVSERHNLAHFTSYDTAAVCQNKTRLRRALGDNFSGNIRYIPIKSEKDIESWHQYPYAGESRYLGNH